MPAISPRLEARIAGFLYLLVILLGGFAEVGVREGLVTTGDPAAAAGAIMAHEHFFRLGFAAEMMTNVIALPLTLILYRLLARARRPRTVQFPHERRADPAGSAPSRKLAC